jgi:H+/Cl- antiporter ClcA
MNDFNEFSNKVWNSANPILAIIWAAICWVMFPNNTYLYAAIAVGLASLVDLITKYFALSINNGGYKKATKAHIINSDTLWRKTSIKFVSYLSIAIMTGLSIRVAPVELLANGLATLVYSIIFVREFQSVIENCIEAGADGLEPLLFSLKKKEKEICKMDKKEEK